MDLSRIDALLPKDSVQRAVIAVFGLSIVYVVGLVIHRLFISPLSKFPGPKLAAITSWYELYYDVAKQGQFLWEIERMHDKYGMLLLLSPGERKALNLENPQGLIVRINPFELSIRDSDYYDELYVVGSVRHTDRYEAFTEGLVDFDRAHLATVEHELHHKRRAPLDPYFSKGGISKLEPMIWDLTDKLMSLVRELQGNRPGDFSPWWFDIFHGIAVMLPTFMCVPWLTRLLRHVPQSILLWLDPKAQKFNKLKVMCDDHIKATKNEASSPAGTMNFLCYYVMTTPAIRNRLEDELAPLMKDYPEKKPSWAELEQLPYFQAIIKESLRLSYGTIHRRPRVSPNVSLHYREWVIPAGVPVGMSAYVAHRDPANLPEPDRFLPERWLGDVTPGMRKNYVPFSKGSRHCLGMHLAYREINFAMAALFRPGSLSYEMYDTVERDVKPVHDMIVPLPQIGTKGVRLTFY